MRIVPAAPSARRSFTVAGPAVLAVSCARTGQQDFPYRLDARACSKTTAGSDATLTTPDTLQVVRDTAAPVRAAFDAATPGVKTITRDRIDAYNAAAADDALKYEPSPLIRKRFIGERHSVFAGRDFNALQSARRLVYADGLLLSNLPGSGDAFLSRWPVIAPANIGQVEALYGMPSAHVRGQLDRPRPADHDTQAGRTGIHVRTQGKPRSGPQPHLTLRLSRVRVYGGNVTSGGKNHTIALAALTPHNGDQENRLCAPGMNAKPDSGWRLSGTVVRLWPVATCAALRIAARERARAKQSGHDLPFLVVDLEARYPFDRHRLASPGIYNMTDCRYHASRAYPGRTLYGEHK